MVVFLAVSSFRQRLARDLGWKGEVVPWLSPAQFSIAHIGGNAGLGI